MTDPRKLSIKDYTYTLPEERIARYPLADRDASKLLIYKDGKITEDVYNNIAEHIPGNSLLIFNDTKVVEARLLFQKPTGGVIEIFCLEPHREYADITTAMSQHRKVQWHCLIGGASKWKHGQILVKKIKKDDKEYCLEARYIEKMPDSFIVELSWDDASLSFAEVLHWAGAIPLPPYLKREAESSDKIRYQTIYAHYDGSVAAPTAGLHFTEAVFEKMRVKNIQKDFVTLHVGAGTFKPVKSEIMNDHEMHSEFIDVSLSTIKNIHQHINNKIISVGTTSLRAIESLYWIGVKLKINGEKQITDLGQWECYNLSKYNIAVPDAFNMLIEWMEKNNAERLLTKTQIIIAPGYTPRIIKGLITNFHQPQSTLLLLVAAMIGKGWKQVYEHALKNDFRFLSYGDGSLLWASQA